MSSRDAGGIERRTPLRVDAAKIRAWQQRGAERYAAKQRARRQAARATSRIDRKPRAGNDWPLFVRKLAAQRSGGVCEIDGEHPATHLHHRKLRRHGDHRIVNALHVCRAHHDEIHGRANNGTIRRSYELGWLVRANADPEHVPIVLHDLPQLLTVDGDYREAA